MKMHRSLRFQSQELELAPVPNRVGAVACQIMPEMTFARSGLSLVDQQLYESELGVSVIYLARSEVKRGFGIDSRCDSPLH